jgi:hypothetical protein
MPFLVVIVRFLGSTEGAEGVKADESVRSLRQALLHSR